MGRGAWTRATTALSPWLMVYRQLHTIRRLRAEASIQALRANYWHTAADRAMALAVRLERERDEARARLVVAEAEAVLRG